MSLPNTFATQPTGNVPAAFLDQNFAALGAIDCVPGVASGTDNITVTPFANTPDINSYAQLQGVSFVAVADNTGAVTLRVGALAFLNVYKPSTGGPTALAAGDIQDDGYYQAYYDAALNGGAGGFHILGIIEAGGGGSGSAPPVRQTVLSGPVDTNGLPDFGGATGATTVTMTGTLTVTAAQGFGIAGSVDRIGQIVNAAWTGLSTNGTMYLYLDIAANGTCTTGSSVPTLPPIYQFGGTPATTAGQFTFNVQEMTGYIGNGGAAPAGYRVYVGQVTVAGGVVTAITWYALMGRYASPITATLPSSSTATSLNHNIGTTEIYGTPTLQFTCTTADNGYSIGHKIYQAITNGNTTLGQPTIAMTSNLAMRFITGGATAWYSAPLTGGNSVPLDVNDWSYRLMISRGW